METSLRNQKGLARLHFVELLMGNPKDRKSSVRRTQTRSDNDESEVSAELQVGYQGTHLSGRLELIEIHLHESKPMRIVQVQMCGELHISRLEFNKMIFSLL